MPQTSQAATQEHDPVMPLYRPINPTEPYNKEDLIGHYEDLMDIQDYVQTLQKDPENTDAREDAGGLLRKNPNYYFTANRSPRSDLEKALSEGYDDFMGYAERHSSELYRELEPEDYVELVRRVPLYKTGNKEHDGFVEMMNEFRKIAEASQDPQKMAEYVGKKAKNFPTWAQISFMRYGENDLKLIFQSYANASNARLEAIMFDKKGNLRSGFLEEVFKKSLEEAESDFAEETIEKERKDIRERNIRPYYMALVEQVYKIDKAKEKEDPDYPEKKKDRDERRKDRRAKGMPF